MGFNLSNGRFSEKSLGRILTGVVFVYQAVAAVALVWAFVVAVQWVREPFLGSYYEHTLVFTDTGGVADAWAFNQIVNSGDQLLAVNGVEVKNSRDVRNVIAGNFVPGENVNLTVRFKSGDVRVLNVELQRFPEDGISVYLVLPTILSLIFLALSIWTFGLRRNEPAGRAFTMFASSFSIITGTIFNLWTSHEFTLLWTFACAFAGGSTIALALSFPTSPRLLINRPYLRWVGFIISLLLAGMVVPYLFNTANPVKYIPLWQNIYYFDAISILTLLGFNFYYAAYSQSPVGDVVKI